MSVILDKHLIVTIACGSTIKEAVHAALVLSLSLLMPVKFRFNDRQYTVDTDEIINAIVMEGNKPCP